MPDFFHEVVKSGGGGEGTGGTYRYLSIPSERLVIRERNVWYPPFRLRTLRYRTQKKPKSERERGRTFFFPTRQSSNACSVCPLSVLPRLWGAVRHGTGEKKKRAAASHHLRPLHLAVPSEFFIGFIAFLTIRAHR